MAFGTTAIKKSPVWAKSGDETNKGGDRTAADFFLYQKVGAYESYFE